MTNKVLELHEQGRSQRQIATALGLSQSRVNRVLQRSRHVSKPGENYIDARTLAAVGVPGRGTARQNAQFILEHSSTKEGLGGQHVAFIQASLDRLTADAACCPEHRLSLNEAGEYCLHA